MIRSGRIHLSNGDPVPNDGTSRGLQAAIDAFLARSTPASVPPPPQIAYIHKVTESHILQVSSTTDLEDNSDSDEDIFKVFAAEKKRHAGKPSKLPEATPMILEVPSKPKVDATKLTPTTQPQLHKEAPLEKLSKPPMQYQYHSTAEDQRLVEELLA